MSDDHASGRWQALAITAIAVVLSMTTWFSATAVAPELAVAWELGSDQAAWLTNAVQVGFVLGALASSLLAIPDVLPLTKLMAASTVVAGLANAVLLVEPAFWIVVAARITTGIALAGIYPPAMKFLATWFRKGRGLALGTMVGALTLGSALPHLVRAFGAGVEWSMVVIAGSLACLIAAGIFATMLREGPFAFARTHVDIRQIGQVVRNRPVMLANLGYFGHMWELYAMWGWILAFSTAAAATGNWALNASLLAFAVVAMGAPGCVIAGWLADRIGRCYTTAIALGISGTSALLIGIFFGASPTIFMVIALIWGLSIVADSAQFSAAVTELSDQTLVGSALAFQMGVGFAITIFTIWLIPQIAEALGSWRWSFLVLVPGPIVGTVAMLRLRARPEATAIAGGLR